MTQDGPAGDVLDMLDRTFVECSALGFQSVVTSMTNPAAVDLAALDRLSRRLLEQVLALPLATLEAGAVPLDPVRTQYVRRLFALDHGGPA